MLLPLKVGIKHLMLDRGFYSVSVIRNPPSSQSAFYHAWVIRGKKAGTRALLQSRKSYATDYTLKSVKHGSLTCQMRVVCYGELR